MPSSRASLIQGSNPRLLCPLTGRQVFKTSATWEAPFVNGPLWDSPGT